MSLNSIAECAALLFLGVSFGALVAAGLFAFVVKIGVVTRLMAGTKTVKHIGLYEDAMVIGVTAANIISIFKPPLSAVGWLMPVFGVFSGVYVGCLAVALAEIVNVIPVFTSRIKLKYGLPFLVMCFAFGKAFGVWYQLYLKK